MSRFRKFERIASVFPRSGKGDVEGAVQDFSEAIRLGYKPPNQRVK